MLLLAFRFSFVHPVSILMVKQLLSTGSYERQWTPFEKISPALVNAVLVSEDSRFCEHHGVDWQALQQVVSDDEGPQRGASTITMQLVKNLFLWQDRSYIRKAVEIPYAMIADALLSKKRIMKIYLNIVEWGPGIYGADAAAHYYFGQSAQNLSSIEGALLAVALPNPETRNPAAVTPRLAYLARIIEARAYRAGAYIACLQ